MSTGVALVPEVDAVLSGVSASRLAEVVAGVLGFSAGRAGDGVEPGRAAKGVGTAPGNAAAVGRLAADVVDAVEAVLFGVSASPRAGVAVVVRGVNAGRLTVGVETGRAVPDPVVGRIGLPVPVVGLADVDDAVAGFSGIWT